MLGFLLGLSLGITIGLVFCESVVMLRKAFRDLSAQRHDDSGAVAWQDLLVICMAIVVLSYGVAFWFIARGDDHQNQRIEQVVHCNQAGLVKTVDSLNERSEFTNSLASRELEQDESLQHALVTLTDPEAPPSQQKQVLLNYLRVTAKVNALAVKAQHARIQHPLPTVRQIVACYKDQ